MLSVVYRRYRSAFAGLSPELWVLALVLFVNRSGAMVLAYLTLYLTSEIGMPSGSAGHMISVFGVGAIAGAYLGGRLVEVVGAVRLQTICLLVAVPGYWAIPVWSNPWAIALNVFLLSMATEAVRPANATMVAKLAPADDRARAFALQRLAANLGFACGGALGGVLASINFRYLFVVDGCTTLAAASILIAHFRFRRLPGEAPRRSVDLPTPVTDRVFVAFLGLFLLATMVFFQFLATYTLYLHEYYALKEWQIGALFAINTLVVAVFEMLLIDVAKRWPLLRTVGWGCFLSCLGFGLLPFGSSFAFAVFAMLVMTMGEMLSMPLAAGYVANRAPAGAEGRYMGWWAMCISLAFVFGPAIGGTLYAADPNLVWYVSLVVAVLVLAGYYLLPEDESRSADQELSTTKVFAHPEPGDLLGESAGS